MKKIIKYILIIFLSIILIPVLFVGITNNELKGTWIGGYSVHPNMELYLPYERVITLSNFSYFEQGPKYELTIERKGYFVKVLDIIKSRDNSYDIITINNDSLQVKNEVFMESNYKTFYRIDDSLKNNQKIEIAGKTFSFSNYKVTDTIHFKNDSIFENINYKYSSRWQLMKHEGFQILFMEEIPSFVITNKNGNSIKLKRFENTNDNYIMTEIE